MPSDTLKNKAFVRRLAGGNGALGFVVSRIAGLVVTLLVASAVIWGALYLAPGSPLTFLTKGRTQTPAALAQLKHQYHLDEPVYQQYWHWLTDVMRGRFGSSILYNQDVGSLIGGRAVTTLLLVAFASLIIVLGGLALGTYCALRPGWLASSLMAVVTATMAVPAFVAAVTLILVFGVQLGWFPVFGSGSDEGLWQRLVHLVLPAAALALAAVAFVARLTQAAVRQEHAADHVQTAVSRGLPYRSVIRRHVLRNAAVPVLTVAGVTVAGLLAGSVVVEQAFQLNGLGSYLVASVQQKDFPVVQAVCLLYVAAFIVLSALIDVAYALLDPRITFGQHR